MSTRSFSLFLAVLMMLTAATAVLAQEKAPAEPKAPALSELDGQQLFKQVCKTCHAEGAAAGEVTPMSLIMEQWDEFFDGTFKTAHEAVVCPSDATKKVTDILDADMLKKLRKFCVDHAADSEAPMTCG